MATTKTIPVRDMTPQFKEWCLKQKRFNPESIKDKEDIMEALIFEFEDYLSACQESYLEDLEGLDENDIY